MHSLRNPTPGKIINRPDGEDVYHGVLKDYTGLKVESTVYRNFGPCVFNSFYLFDFVVITQSPLVKLTKIDLGSPPPIKKIILGTLHLDSHVEGSIVTNSDFHH